MCAELAQPFPLAARGAARAVPATKRVSCSRVERRPALWGRVGLRFNIRSHNSKKKEPDMEESSGDSVVSFWTIWGVILDEGRRTTSPRSVYDS